MRLRVNSSTIGLRIALSNPRLSHSDVGKLFSVTRSLVCQWTKGTKQPDSRPCVCCGKSLNDMVSDWINDGTIK